MSEVGDEAGALTQAELDALIDAVMDDRDREGGYRVLGPGGTDGQTPTLREAAERIIAARLAPIEALMAEWDADLDSGRIRDLDARYCWNTALNELRRAMTAPPTQPGTTP